MFYPLPMCVLIERFFGWHTFVQALLQQVMAGDEGDINLKERSASGDPEEAPVTKRQGQGKQCIRRWMMMKDDKNG